MESIRILRELNPRTKICLPNSRNSGFSWNNLFNSWYVRNQPLQSVSAWIFSFDAVQLKKEEISKTIWLPLQKFVVMSLPSVSKTKQRINPSSRKRYSLQIFPSCNMKSCLLNCLNWKWSANSSAFFAPTRLVFLKNWTSFSREIFFMVDGWWLAVDGWRLTVDGWRLTVDGWRLTVDGWRLTVFSMTDDRWRLILLILFYFLTVCLCSRKNADGRTAALG